MSGGLDSLQYYLQSTNVRIVVSLNLLCTVNAKTTLYLASIYVYNIHYFVCTVTCE